MCSLTAALRRQRFTQAQLQKAFVDRRKPGWPINYSEAMQDPFYAVAVEIEARRQANKQKLLAQQQAPKATVQTLRSCVGMDFKRRAAGEKDDE